MGRRKPDLGRPAGSARPTLIVEGGGDSGVWGHEGVVLAQCMALQWCGTDAGYDATRSKY
eukprot:3556557-Rhodomonas_salina.1